MQLRDNKWPLKVSAIGIATLVLFIVLGGPFFNGWGDLVIPVAMSVASAWGINYFVDRKDDEYTARVSSEASLTWQIYANAIQIGTITDQEYAAIQRHVLRDGRTAVAQVANLSQVAMNVIDKLLIAVPVIVFWGVLCLMLFSPENFIDLLKAMQSATADQISAFFRNSTLVIATVTLTCIVVTLVFGAQFGFRNCYEDEIQRKLRFHCKTPIESPIWLAQMGPEIATNIG